MPKLILIVVALVVLGAFVYFRPNLLPSQYHQDQTNAKVLFVVQAPSGTLEPTKLTLKNPDKHLVWFTDRPAREAGRFSLEAAVANWDQSGLNMTPPNAALTLNEKETVIVTLNHPVFDTKNDTLTFMVSQIGPSNMDTTKPITFKDGSLFIDSVNTEVQILNSLPKGAINATIYKDNTLLGTK